MQGIFVLFPEAVKHFNDRLRVANLGELAPEITHSRVFGAVNRAEFGLHKAQSATNLFETLARFVNGLIALFTVAVREQFGRRIYLFLYDSPDSVGNRFTALQPIGHFVLTRCTITSALHAGA